MKIIKSFLSLLEGGWGTTLNQNTKLTPPLVRKVLHLTEKFFDKYNKYAKKEGFNEIEFIGPVGSVSYYDKDDPEKEYGDIDCLISIPKDESKSDYKNVKINYDNILNFVEKSNLPYIVPVPESKTAGQFIMIKDGDNYVQVDLIFTFTHTKDWAKARYKPEHGVKGALYGNLLSSLAEILNLSIQGYGVQQKTKDGIVVPFRTQKADLKTISINPKEFLIDILINIVGKNAKIHNDLKKYSGFNLENVKIEDIARGIKGLAKSFTLNDAYNKGQLRNISDENDFLEKVASIYRKKMDKAITATKFDKVTSEYGKEKAQKVKQQFDEVSKKIIDFLKS
jgi:hypothetical protein